MIIILSKNINSTTYSFVPDRWQGGMSFKQGRRLQVELISIVKDAYEGAVMGLIIAGGSERWMQKQRYIKKAAAMVAPTQFANLSSFGCRCYCGTSHPQCAFNPPLLSGSVSQVKSLALIMKMGPLAQLQNGYLFQRTQEPTFVFVTTHII